jgi:hypothetical protein
VTAARLYVVAIAAALLSPLHAAASTYVEKLSCTSGPYRVKLPRSYKAVRALAPLKRERVLRTEDHGTYKANYRELRFNGLELIVVTLSHKPNEYILSKAVLSSPAWKIGGQLRVGSAAKSALRGLPVKDFSPDAEIDLAGDSDSIRVTLANGRVQEVDYDCYVG